MKRLILCLAILLMISSQPQAQQVQGCGTMISQIECTYFVFQGMNCKLNLADSITFPSGTNFYIEGNLRLNCFEQFCPFTSVPHCIDVDYIEICDTTPDCDIQMPGDVNGSGFVDISDIVYLHTFIYSGGPSPILFANGDPNGDCRINIGDLIYLAAYIEDGPPPVDCTCNDPAFGQEACCFGIRGNANYDPQDQINISDVVYLVQYSFSGGPAPKCTNEANVDGLGFNIDMGDIVALVGYSFLGGAPPAPCY